MSGYATQPVIVGAGLSGLLVSRALSQAEVRHTLVGEPPTTDPRLGESLSLDASLAFLNLMPELSSFFFSKKRVVTYVGDYLADCNVELADVASRSVLRALGYRTIGALLHVDRIGLDQALFQAVVANRFCTHVRSLVTDIAFDPRSDRIEALVLEGDETVTPATVFDATNHLRLIGRATGVSCEMTNPLQRVAYTHLHLAADDDGPDAPWRHSTSLLRLYGEVDGLDGGAWCVPLGQYVSIGVSVLADSGTTQRTDGELLEIAHAAFERRGLDYRVRFVHSQGPLGMKHRYFKHERGWGANWLLVGPSNCQVWWPSSTGVGSSLAAANIAAAFTRNAAKVGPLYQTYIDELGPAHDHLDWFMTVDEPPTDRGVIERHLKPLIHGHLVRLSVFTQMHHFGLAKLVGRLLYRLSRRRVRSNIACRLESVPLCDQTAALYPTAAV